MDIVLKKKCMNRDEVALLVDLIQSNPIIISKETNAATNKIKDETWNSLTSTYNAKSGSVPRTREQLKLKWDNLKKAARKRAQQIRMNILKTGGGKPDFIPPDEILEKVSEILGPTCTGFTVPFGDDGVGVSEIQEYLDTASDNIEGIPIDIEILNTSTKDKEVEVCKESHSAATTKSFFGCTRSKQVLKRGKRNADVESRVARNYAIARYYEAKKDKIDLEITFLKLKLEKVCDE